MERSRGTHLKADLRAVKSHDLRSRQESSKMGTKAWRLPAQNNDLCAHGQGRKENDDRIFQVDMETIKLFENNGRYQVSKNDKGNSYMKEDLKMGKQIRYRDVT